MADHVVIRGAGPARRRRGRGPPGPPGARRRRSRRGRPPVRRCRSRRRPRDRPPGLTVLPGLIDCHTHLVGDLEYAGVPARRPAPPRRRSRGVRNARATIEAGFTTVRDVGTFRAFVDVALRDAIDAGGAWARGCSAPAPTSRRPGAAATSPAWRTTSPPTRRPPVRRRPVAGRGPAARPRAGRRRRRRHQADRDRRGADPRHSTPTSSSSDEATVRACSRRPPPTACSSRPTPTARRASRSRPGPAPARSSTARSSTTRASRCSGDERHLPGRGPVRRRLDRRGRDARRLAGGDDGEEPADDRCAAGGVPEGRRGGGPARLRHGQWRLSARAERPAAPLPGSVRDDVGGRDPLGDGRRGGADGLGGPGRAARARIRRRPDRGRWRSVGGRRRAGRRPDRDQGRHRGQGRGSGASAAADDQTRPPDPADCWAGASTRLRGPSRR